MFPLSVTTSRTSQARRRAPTHSTIATASSCQGKNNFLKGIENFKVYFLSSNRVLDGVRDCPDSGADEMPLVF